MVSDYGGYNACMARFLGGSAFAMVQQMKEGYILVTERTFKMMSRADLDKLGFEIDKQLRGVRGDQAPLDDLEAIKTRNRRIQRLNSGLNILRGFRKRHRR